MPNLLDDSVEMENKEGKDVFVINKQIPIEVGVGSKIFEVMLWILGIIPGIVFLFMKVNANSYLRKLEQKLQHDASRIDNYLEQRVIILKNAAKLLDRAVDLDKDVMINITRYRSGNHATDDTRNNLNKELSKLERNINVAFENYPNLESHRQISKILDQNSYLQKEITAARELYNDTVNRWNNEINSWPTNMIVAAKKGYTTRIPFQTTREIKDKARDVFF